MADSNYKKNKKKLKTVDLSFVLKDFRKGMVDDIVSKADTDDNNYAYDLKNFILDSKGNLFKRPGTEVIVDGALVERYNLDYNGQKTQGFIQVNNLFYGLYNGVIYQLNHLVAKPLIWYEYLENNVLDADEDNLVIQYKLLTPGIYKEQKPYQDGYFTKNIDYKSIDGDATSFAIQDNFIYWLSESKMLFRPTNDKYWKLDINGNFNLLQQTGEPIITDILNVDFVDKASAWLEVPAKRIDFSLFNNLGANEYAKIPSHRVTYYKDFSNNNVIENLDLSLIKNNFFGNETEATIVNIKDNVFSGKENSPYLYNYDTNTGDDVIIENLDYSDFIIGKIRYPAPNTLYSVWLKDTQIDLTFTETNGNIINQSEAFWLGNKNIIYFNSFISNPHNSDADGSNFYFRNFSDKGIGVDTGPDYFTFNLLGEIQDTSVETFDIPEAVYLGYDGYESDYFLKALIPVDFEQDRNNFTQMYAGINANVTGVSEINYPDSNEINLNDTSKVHKILDYTNDYEEQGVLLNENDIKTISTYDNNFSCNINVSGSYDVSGFDLVNNKTDYDIDTNMNEVYDNNWSKYVCNISNDYGFKSNYDNVFQFLDDSVKNGYGTKFMYINIGDLFYEFIPFINQNVFFHLVLRHYGYNKDLDNNTTFDESDYGYSNTGTYYLDLPIFPYESMQLYGNEFHQFDGTNNGLYDEVFLEFISDDGILRWDMSQDKIIKHIRESVNYSFNFPSTIENGRTIYDFQSLIDFFGMDNWINNNFKIYYKMDSDTDYTLMDFDEDNMIKIKEILERQNPTTTDYPIEEQWTLIEPPKFIFAYFQTNINKTDGTLHSTPNFGTYTSFLYVDETLQNAYTDINFELAGIVPNQYPITTGKPVIFYGCVADLQTGLEENSLGAYTKYYQWKLYRTEDIHDDTIIGPDLATKDQWKTGFDATRQKTILANSTGYILYLFAMKELDYEGWLENTPNTTPDIKDIQVVSYEFLPQDLLPDITIEDYKLLTSSGNLKINNGIMNYKGQNLIYGADKIYISLLNDFGYYPFSFVLNFSNTAALLDVRSIRYVQKSLLVLTNKNLYNLSGSTPLDFELSLINDNYGLLTKNATAALDVGLAFLSTQGIVKLTNYAWGTEANLNIEYISKNIQNRIFTLLDDKNNYLYASATLWLNYFVINIWDLKNSKYYLYFYNNDNKSWFRWESKYFDLLKMYTHNGDLYLVRKNNLEILKVGYKTLYNNFINKNGYIDRYTQFKIDKNNDIVDTIFESPLIKFGYDDYLKKYKKLNVYFNAGAVPTNFYVSAYNENGVLLDDKTEIRETEDGSLYIFPENSFNKLGKISVQNYFDIASFDTTNFYQDNKQEFNLIEEKYNLVGQKGLYMKYNIEHKEDADFSLNYVTVDLKIKKAN